MLQNSSYELRYTFIPVFSVDICGNAEDGMVVGWHYFPVGYHIKKLLIISHCIKQIIPFLIQECINRITTLENMGMLLTMRIFVNK